MNSSQIKRDICLIAILLVIAVVALVAMNTSRKKEVEQTDGFKVVITANGTVVKTFPYGEEFTYTIVNPTTQKTNTVVGTADGVYMEYAECPDKKCISQGLLTPESIFAIVCMPNGVYVQIYANSSK